jgi:hypothetical protein
MKKILISLLLVNNLSLADQEVKSPVKKGILVGSGLIVVAGCCYGAKHKWSSIAWTSQKYLKNQLELLKIDLSYKFSDLRADVFGIKKDVNSLRNGLDNLATKADTEALAGELKNLQKNLEEATNKIIAAVEKHKS